MSKKTIILIVLLIVSGATFLSGCVKPDGKNPGANITDNFPGNFSGIKISELEQTQELKKFSSIQEIRDFLKTNTQVQNYNLYGGGVFGRGDVMNSVAMPTSAMSKGAAEGLPAPAPVTSGTQDYSTTNIQVQGVDEADFVKNDGKYIYTLSQDKLVIVDAFPAEKAKIVSETVLTGIPKNMFIKDDRLLVFTEDNSQTYVYPEYDYRPMPRYTPRTVAFVYDISDRTKPKLLNNYSINGNYFQSRMIGDYVYFIAKDPVNYYDNVVDVPVIRQGTSRILAPDIYYFDNPEQNYVFHTIASINIKSGGINAKSFMMGYSDNLYVSENNIYITYRKNMPYRYYEVQKEERFYKVVVPLLPEDTRNKINEIKGRNINSYEKWDLISAVLENSYNNMDEKGKKDFSTNVEKAGEEYDIKLAQETEKTVIHKIGIDKGDITYKTRGEVPGMLLNQFSMDESGDHFRVATTSQFWTNKGQVQFNNVYVMDKELAIVGTLEEIAPDERIYSTRFIGNRLYMVTFKRIDPLFVIDLSNPKDPKVLGKLKIPGFSDYLHPYDENHIIGVGKETGNNEWGGVSIKGVKVSLFDVSDVEHPKQIDSYEIGKPGSDSEALRDHKAFLFDKQKNLLVIPIREIGETKQVYDRYGPVYRQKVWQGAYVFGVTTDGFKLKGKISHLDDYEDQMYSWNSPSAVRRSLYMDDVLYTVSARKIMMNSLADIKEINSIDLPFMESRYFEYGWN
jgi:uncharacterized secreted protein with C-terminal beta-propeller domain